MVKSLKWIFPAYKLQITSNSWKYNLVVVIKNAVFTMNQFNLGQRRIGEEKNKEISNLLTESKRAGKESTMKVVNLFVSSQKDFDGNDEKNATFTNTGCVFLES